MGKNREAWEPLSTGCSGKTSLKSDIPSVYGVMVVSQQRVGEEVSRQGEDLGAIA